jgi:hypothetical protein
MVNPYKLNKSILLDIMTYAYNASYSGGRDQENLGSRPAHAKS